jgi:hypothetical protein
VSWLYFFTIGKSSRHGSAFNAIFTVTATRALLAAGIYGRVAITELYARGFFADPPDLCDETQMTNMADHGGVSVKSGAHEDFSLSDVDTSLGEEHEDAVNSDGEVESQHDGDDAGAASSVDVSTFKHILKGRIAVPEFHVRDLRLAHQCSVFPETGTPKWRGRKIRGEHFVTMATPHLGVRKSQEFILTKFWNWAAEKLTGMHAHGVLPSSFS